MIGGLDSFVSYCQSACLATAPTPTGALAMCEASDLEGVLVVDVGSRHPEEAEAVMAELFAAPPRRYAAMATLGSWAPDGASECADSWVLTAVDRSARPARFLVGRIDAGDWFAMAPTEAVWFQLSTAGALRALLRGECTGPLRRATDDALYNRPFDGKARPRVHEDGTI